jgi:hypothetical protein
MNFASSVLMLEEVKIAWRAEQVSFFDGSVDYNCHFRIENFVSFSGTPLIWLRGISRTGNIFIQALIVFESICSSRISRYMMVTVRMASM